MQAREGYGGGFNERQDRASVATVEVDEDGYDDFGRKKIKARADKKAKEVRRRTGPTTRFRSLRRIGFMLRVLSVSEECDAPSNFRP